MRNEIRILAVTITLFLFVNCNKIKYTGKDFHYLNFSDSLTINVVKSSIHSKALLLNDSVVLYKTSKLIFESHNPKWLFDKTKNKELFNDEYIYSPDVSEIEAPYKLIKLKQSNVFQIIKEMDTLYFDFNNFDKPDFWF